MVSKVGFPIRAGYYRTILKKLGENVNIGRNGKITQPENVEINSYSSIEDDVTIIGGNGVSLGEHVIIQRRTTIEGAGYDVSMIQIGDYTNISKYCYLHGGGGIIIGKDVLIGPHCVINSTQHKFEDVSIIMRKQGTELKRIVIQDNVWLGANVTVTLGVTLGEGSIIGAGAVVTKDIPPYAVAVGVPAKVIKYRGRD